MVDATKRPLQVPSRFVPYLEKHQIYRLFHYLASQLVLQRPEDHIIFLKNLLLTEGRSWNKLRIILLAPPHVDKMKISDYISQSTGVVVVKAEDMDQKVKEGKSIQVAVSEMLCSEAMLSNGWILANFPRTLEEGMAIKNANILPTHVIHLVQPKPEDDLSLCIDTTAAEEEYRVYRQNIRQLHRIFQHIIKDCKVEDRDTQQLAAECMKLIRVLKHNGEAMLPRIAIIGPRGSGKKTQAKLLQQKYGLVPIDWKFLVEETLIREDKLGETVRRAKSFKTDIYPSVAVKILEDRLLHWDCQKKGWVLTGFHEADILNKLVTPPNRFVFFNVDAQTCINRVTTKRVNVYTGERYSTQTDPPMGKELQQTVIHPDDALNPFNNEVDLFMSNMERIRNACGENVVIVDACQPIRNVFEAICAAIIRPLPPYTTPPAGTVC